MRQRSPGSQTLVEQTGKRFVVHGPGTGLGADNWRLRRDRRYSVRESYSLRFYAAFFALAAASFLATGEAAAFAALSTSALKPSGSLMRYPTASSYRPRCRGWSGR